MPERLNLVVFRCVTRISGLAFRSGLGIHWNVIPSMIKFGTRIYIYVSFFQRWKRIYRKLILEISYFLIIFWEKIVY